MQLSLANEAYFGIEAALSIRQRLSTYITIGRDQASPQGARFLLAIQAPMSYSHRLKGIDNETTFLSTLLP
jgi:hypothetical protein